jgi:hypothetical protein
LYMLCQKLSVHTDSKTFSRPLLLPPRASLDVLLHQAVAWL